MSRWSRSVVLALMLGGFGDPHPATAQPLTVATFPAAYLKAEESLYRKYVFNRRAKYRIAVNVSKEASGKLGASSLVEVTVGENASRHNDVTDATPRDPNVVVGSLQLQGEAYSLTPGGRAGTYKIGAHRPGGGSGKYGYAFAAAGPCLYPVTYMSSVAQTTTGGVLAHIDAKLATGPQYKLLSVRTTEWRGRPAVEAKFEQSHGLINLLYLDPSNDLAFLGFDSDGEVDPRSGAKSPVRLTGWVTYKSSAEGFPLPERIETWFVLPGGKRVPNSLAEVTEYVKYTPTIDDFDLEKQFGVKPLPLPGIAAVTSGGRSWRWLYPGAVVLGLVTLALALVTRRRRRAAA